MAWGQGMGTRLAVPASQVGPNCASRADPPAPSHQVALTSQEQQGQARRSIWSECDLPGGSAPAAQGAPGNSAGCSLGFTHKHSMDRDGWIVMEVNAYAQVRVKCSQRMRTALAIPVLTDQQEGDRQRGDA